MTTQRTGTTEKPGPEASTFGSPALRRFVVVAERATSIAAPGIHLVRTLMPKSASDAARKLRALTLKSLASRVDRQELHSQPQTRLRRSIARNIRVGTTGAFLLVGGGGLWAATSELSGAVIATGHLVVDSNVKHVQHLQGGVVGEISVSNGTLVKAGDVVVRLDDTLARTNLAIVSKGLDELGAKRARLLAEREGAATISYPGDLLSRISTESVKRLVEGESRLFALRRKARDGQVAQLKERIAQLDKEIAGIEAQKAGKAREIALIRSELEATRSLWKKQLVSFSRLSELERAEARLEAENGQLTAATAQARGRISEIGIAIIQIDQEMRSEVARELGEIEAKTAELEERKVAAEQSLRQIDIRAPQSGRVHQLTVHTIGGVIAPGESIMQIVPTADDLVVEAQVAPQDIDQIHPHQQAILRLSAFSQQTTPEIGGRVDHVSPDLIHDTKAGISYYMVRINLSKDDIERANLLELKPGMPVDVFLRTNDRTVLSYLLKPLSDQVTRAFREE